MAAKKKVVAVEPVAMVKVPSAIEALTVKATDGDRSSWVKSRIITIARSTASNYIENGLLLKEILDHEYFKAWDYNSFDDCITCLQEAGHVDYGSRNARNFIAVVEMVEKQGIPMDDAAKIPISKLREIASITDPKAQQKLLAASNDMDVSEVQKEAKRLRDKAKGIDTDPYSTLSLRMTETQRGFFMDCLSKAREHYGVTKDTQDAVVLVDMILPEWFGGLMEHEAIEAEVA